MNVGFLIGTLVFIVVSVAMILIILVQRPQGGGLAGAFGGAGGAGAETVFGGRVGDALTWATVIAFVIYLGMAITLNKIESEITTEPVAADTGAASPGTAADAPVSVTPTSPPASGQPGESPTSGLQPYEPTPEEEAAILEQMPQQGVPAGGGSGGSEQ